MIRVGPSTVFTTAVDGDMRGSESDRMAVADLLGIDREWATVDQVHGAKVVTASVGGNRGEADAIVTATPHLPIAVMTADCLGVVMRSAGAVAVAHGGWRGIAAGVMERAADVLERLDAPLRSVVIGPHIQSCCFEVGPEVSERFPGFESTTTWGTTSVDLAAVVGDRLGVDPVVIDGCTHCGGDTHSHRRDATTSRMAAVAWIR